MTEQLVNYNITDAAIGEMREQYMRLRIVDLDDKDGAKAVSAARRAVKAKRCEVERLRKELKADALELGRKVDAEAKRITDQLAPIEKHLEDEESRIEQERARIKAEEEARAEAERQAKMERIMRRVQALAPLGVYVGPEAAGAWSEMEYEEVLEEAQRAQAEREAERKAEEQRLEQIRREQEAERKRIAEERQAIEEEKLRLAKEKAAREREERKAEQDRRAKFQADLDDIARQGEEIKAAMPPDFGPFVEIATSCDTCLPTIEREAMIKALRWVRDRMPTGLSTIEAALERLKNGGDL